MAFTEGPTNPETNLVTRGRALFSGRRLKSIATSEPDFWNQLPRSAFARNSGFGG